MTASRDGVESQSGSDPRAPTAYQTTFDREQTAPSMAVVAALSDVMDVDPVEMAPLQETVDTDALDAILGDRSVDSERSVSLSVAGYSVTVSSEGTVTVAAAVGERTETTDAVASHT